MSGAFSVLRAPLGQYEDIYVAGHPKDVRTDPRDPATEKKSRSVPHIPQSSACPSFLHTPADRRQRQRRVIPPHERDRLRALNTAKSSASSLGGGMYAPSGGLTVSPGGKITFNGNANSTGLSRPGHKPLAARDHVYDYVHDHLEDHETLIKDMFGSSHSTTMGDIGSEFYGEHLRGSGRMRGLKFNG